METTRRHRAAGRARVGEGRDRVRHVRPGARPAPDDARAARAEEPLVAAGGEEVAAEVRQPRALDPEAVNAVDAEENALGLPPAPVEPGERGGDPADRQLDAGTR